MAGLHETWKSLAGETIRTCTIITCGPNELIEPLHDRMPVILHESDWPSWLGETTTSGADLKELVAPYPADQMELWPVDKRVGNVKNEGPELALPIALSA